MMNFYRDISGFTLIESLLTLFIVSLLVFLPYNSQWTQTERIEEDVFWSQLQEKLNEAQLYSIVAGNRSQVSFNQEGVNVSALNTAYSPLDSHLAYPKSIYLDDYDYNFQYIGHSGRVNRFRTIYFNSSQGRVKLAFQLGNGKLRLSYE